MRSVIVSSHLRSLRHAHPKYIPSGASFQRLCIQRYSSRRVSRPLRTMSHTISIDLETILTIASSACWKRGAQRRFKAHASTENKVSAGGHRKCVLSLPNFIRKHDFRPPLSNSLWRRLPGPPSCPPPHATLKQTVGTPKTDEGASHSPAPSFQTQLAPTRHRSCCSRLH